MYSNPGSHFENVYELRIVDGREKLVKTGQTNVYEHIQSFADSTDINVLIQRFMNGDTGALNQVQGQYFDSTQYPKTYAELYERVKAAEKVYDHMPSVVKEKYSSAQAFFEAYGSEDFINFAKAFEVDSASSGSSPEVSGNSKE